MFNRAARKDDRQRILDLESQVAAMDRSQAVIEFTLDGTILRANENFLQAIGYRADEIVGQAHSMFVEPDYARSDDYRRFWDRLRAGEFVAEKFLRLAKGGRPIWIQASYNPMLGADGKPYKVIKFATDVTAIENERERVEKEREARAAEQAAVVSALGDSLDQLAAGNLTNRLTDTFPADYEKLRADFNAAVEKLEQSMLAVAATTGNIGAGAGQISQASDDL